MALCSTWPARRMRLSCRPNCRTALVRLYDGLDGALAFVSGRSLVRHRSAVRAAAHRRHRLPWRGSARDRTAMSAPWPIPFAGPVRAIFRGLVDSHPGTLLEDKIYTFVAALPPGAGSARSAGSGDGETRADFRGRESHHPARQIGDRRQAHGRRQGRGPARPDAPAAFPGPHAGLWRRRHHRYGRVSHPA